MAARDAADDATGSNTPLRVLPNVAPLLWEVVRPRLPHIVFLLLIILVARAASLAAPLATRYVVDDVILQRDTAVLVPLVLAVLAASAVQAVAAVVTMRMSSAEGLRAITYLRCKVQRHVVRLPISAFDSTQSGALAKRIMEDASGGRNLFGAPLSEFIGSILLALYTLGLLIQISPKLTIVALSGFLVCGCIAKRELGRIRPLFKDTLEAGATVSGRLAECLNGIRVVKAYCAEAREVQTFRDGAKDIQQCTMTSVAAASMLVVTLPVVIGLVMAAVIYLAATDILAGSLTLGGFVSFVALLSMTAGPVVQLMTIGRLVAEGLVSLERATELLANRTEDDNPRRKHALGRIRGAVTFDRVSFAYDGINLVLRDVSFHVDPGTSMVLIGPSGTGKSTLLALVAAFYDPLAGAVRVDDVDLSTVCLDSYRSQLGVVQQDCFLFDGTIRDNIAVGRPDATDAEIREAGRLAHVAEFADRLPNGYATLVGERGVKLSMGQRQRVTIARAALANPRILILDEATSNLDPESERAIHEALVRLMRGRTTFIVAHRFSSAVGKADQILLLEQGRVVGSGTHEELYSTRGRYYEFVTRMSGSEYHAPRSMPTSKESAVPLP